MHTHYDYLIIGGGIAGVTAAETIREQDSHAHIAIIEQEPHVLYSRVLLPYYLKRHIPRSKLFLRTLDHFTEKKIDLHQSVTVQAIDAEHKDVICADGKTIGYGTLLIATGGRVKEWGMSEDQDVLYRLQTLDDTDRLFSKLDTIKNPVVVGSSFISLEFLEIFLANHITPTLLVQGEHFFGHLLDVEGGALMQENFERLGIRAYYGDTIVAINRTPKGMEIKTKNSKKIPIDAIAVGVGIGRNLECAHNAGLTIGEQGIKVNEYLETSDPSVFAAGDVAEYYDIISQSDRVAGNWTNAVVQGRRAGLNMAGQRAPFISVPSYSITNLGFQITALGDTLHYDDTVIRIDKDNKQYERFFLKENVLMGAVLINRFRDKNHLAQLIEHKINITPWRDKLSFFTFDINTIPVVY